MENFKQNSREHIHVVASIDNYFNQVYKELRVYMTKEYNGGYFEDNEEYL